MAAGIMKYTASDGSEVKLSPSIVAKYVITGGQKVEDREIYSFMARCQARHLNPLAGDAYMTAYKNRKTGMVEASVIVSKDYFVRTATQQPGFDGLKAGVVVWDKRTGQMKYREGTIYGKASEDLVGGWAEVYDKGRSYPSRAEVSLEEYDQHRSLWLSKPATMIRKVALVQALREAYPGAYGGIYDRNEMPEPPAEVAVQVEEAKREAEAAEREAEAAKAQMQADAVQEAEDERAALQQADIDDVPEEVIADDGRVGTQPAEPDAMSWS
nr:MAG TPA: RecT protein [Caudoviricetes sp.]